MLRLSLILLTCLVCAAPARAWGPEGHSIVAEIAQRRLDPATARLVTELLLPGASLGSIASWADDVRNQRPETGNWHFVDIPSGSQDYDPIRDCSPHDGKGDCVVKALERARDTLACSRSPDARRDALRFAVHFVGDIHQPLHAIGDAMGGNLIQVRGEIDSPTCKPHCGLEPGGGDPAAITNLHAVWDITLIRRTTWNWGAYVERLESGVLTSGAFMADAKGGTPASWAVRRPEN